MLGIMPEANGRWQRESQVIQANHTLQILASKIGRGKEIFHRSLGCETQGFRSGCPAICDNMYQVLADQGLGWSSNLVVNPMGWRYSDRDYDAGEPWQKDVSPHPFPYKAGLLEVPILSEYTWFLREEDLGRHFVLTKDDFEPVRPLACLSPCLTTMP